MQFSLVVGGLKWKSNKSLFNASLLGKCNGYRRKKMNTVTRVQILDEIVCVSRGINTIGKSVNPTILHPPMGK